MTVSWNHLEEFPGKGWLLAGWLGGKQAQQVTDAGLDTILNCPLQQL